MKLDDLARRTDAERRAVAEALTAAGAHLEDWRTIVLRGRLAVAAGVRISAHVVIEGNVRLDENVVVGPYVCLCDVRIGAETEIRPFSSLEGSSIAPRCRIGPYARIRNGCVIGDGSSIGNFVELKATEVGAGGRINHLAFLGDATLGPSVTVGAGVITCNHDGVRTRSTEIDEGAFVGCGTELVAPLTVGRGATVGAGSTITEDVPPGGLTLARSRQTRIAGWTRKADRRR